MWYAYAYYFKKELILGRHIRKSFTRHVIEERDTDIQIVELHFFK